MIRLASRAVALAVLLSSAAIGAARAEFAEKPFAPEIGVRFLVDDVNDSETAQPDGRTETQRVSQKGELTFEAKTPDGYRVSYVVTDLSVTGDAPAVAIVQQAFGTMKGVVFKGLTDARGRPHTIENLEQVRAQMREIAERTAEGFAKDPKVAETMRAFATQLIVLDGVQAAENYLEPLALMSAAQNTGLKPGEERREEVAKPNPFGGEPIKSVTSTRIEAPDPDGVAIVTRTEQLDKDSLKAAMRLIGGQVIRNMGGEVRGLTPAKFEEIVAKLDLSIDGLSVYDVAGGMAQEITTNAETRMSAMGQAMRKSEKRRVTIMRAP
ncbi:hypothetical protein [Methylopila sp. M107]|uniref:hypothetical protein n=1 Tax=Methylopila sp. M107 TaxID=1101190 RepID=UPI00037D842B|nr:hypothetical protein [Methylopila sp. M107]